MSAIALHIVEPAAGSVYTGPASVRFRGAVDTAPLPAPLFYQWYSSLPVTPPPANQGDPFGTTLDETRTLPGPGSYVISLAARDVAGGTPADLKNVKHGGLAGGPQPPSACVIHVMLAQIVEPAAGASLSRASLRLSAKAPLPWGDVKPPAFAPTRTKSAAYDKIDRLQYVWRFDPQGAPAGRASASFTPADLLFDPNASLDPAHPNDAGATPRGPLLRYEGPAPAGLGLGAYRITLRVQDKTNAATGHEATRDVTFTA
ncbi:MAG TPA: hypothetical protein VFF00_03165 [Candidatus Elarobacter sp.]|nr:hypothetical protein [Dongiaceae bacterium]HZW53005.1 hypothetical protein [Candidatus Elarobacter sp.]